MYLSRGKGDRGNYTTYFDLEDHNNRINMVPKNNRRIDAKISEKTKRSQKTLLIWKGKNWKRTLFGEWIQTKWNARAHWRSKTSKTNDERYWPKTATREIATEFSACVVCTLQQKRLCRTKTHSLVFA